MDLLHLSKGEFDISNNFCILVWNSLLAGAAPFEGIVSEREHVDDGEVPQECYHLQ